MPAQNQAVRDFYPEGFLHLADASIDGKIRVYVTRKSDADWQCQWVAVDTWAATRGAETNPNTRTPKQLQLLRYLALILLNRLLESNESKLCLFPVALVAFLSG